MMRRFTILIILPALLCLCSSILAAPRYARVVIGTREVVLTPRALVDSGTVYAPTSILKQLGAEFVQGQSKVTLMHGNEIKDLNTYDRNGFAMVRMDDVANMLGVERQWDDNSSTLRLLGRLVSVDYEGGVITAKTTIPTVVTKTRLWEKPYRLAVDIPGTKVATDTKAFSIGEGAVSGVRIGQFSDDTTRIVVDLDQKITYKLLSSKPSQEIRFSVGQVSAAPAQPAKAVQPVKTVAQPAPNIAKPTIQADPSVEDKPEVTQPEPAAPAVEISAIKPEPDGDATLTVRVSTSGKASFATTLLQSPPRVALDIKNATLKPGDSDVRIDHPLLSNISLAQQGAGVRMVFQSPGYPLFYAEPDGNDILLKFRRPSAAGGKLSDKTIVLDAGHGGNDPGAHGGGMKEKELNLMIVESVKDALEKAGAKVILTRYDDRFIPLALRPAVADNSGADMFVSVHCNALFPERKSGTETYYHTGQDSSRSLACSIQGELIKITGMKDNGVKRDTVLHRSGLAVLRNAKVPAVLIESGYIDCTDDRQKLCDDTFRAKFGEAVVAGLKLYVEGTRTAEGR